MYSARVCLLLVAMVLTGAMRIEAAKLFYQVGFQNPYFVTLLLHLDGFAVLAVYILSNHCVNPNENQGISLSTQENGTENVQATEDVEDSSARNCDDRETRMRELRRSVTIGSCTGINEESHTAANSILQHIHPSFCKLVLPGLLNLLSFLLRFWAVLYVKASVVELLSTGLELIFTVLSSRFLRKRRIPRQRWFGSCFIMFGLVVVAMGNMLETSSDDDTNRKDLSSYRETTYGMILTVATALATAALVMLEEVLTQEGGYDAILVMAMEGVWGFLIGLLFYVPVAPLLDKNSDKTWDLVRESPVVVLFAFLFMVVCAVSGFVSVASVRFTSAMTRTVWQYLRVIPLWIMELAIYYIHRKVDEGSSDKQLGGPWAGLFSVIIFCGFSVMAIGLCVYYRLPTRDTSNV